MKIVQTTMNGIIKLTTFDSIFYYSVGHHTNSNFNRNIVFITENMFTITFFRHGKIKNGWIVNVTIIFFSVYRFADHLSDFILGDVIRCIRYK